MSQLRLSKARSDAELRAAADFRREVFFERRGVVFDEEREARRDRQGHVLVLQEGTKIVASARVLRFPSPLSPLLGHSDALGVDADTEVGRVVAKRAPGSASYALALVALGARWVLDHRAGERYVAYCHPALVELYRLLGARDLGHECFVPGRSEPHRIVCGSVADAARLGGALLGNVDTFDVQRRSA
jgi:hypothetical protein